VESYQPVRERFPTFARSDGVEHWLPPEPKCRLCDLPIEPDYAEWGKCYFCHADPSVDGIELVRILAAALYIPQVQGYLHSEEILTIKSRGIGASIYAEVLVHVLLREKVRDRCVGVVPVPSASKGVPGPGSASLANALAMRLGLPYMDILRSRPGMVTQKEAGNRSSRRRNVIGTMTAGAVVPSGMVFAVDDVTTSGATLREAARALRYVGATAVVGLAAGRDSRLEHLERAGVVVRVEG